MGGIEKQIGKSKRVSDASQPTKSKKYGRFLCAVTILKKLNTTVKRD